MKHDWCAYSLEGRLTNETNDCFVMSIAKVEGLPYVKAHSRVRSNTVRITAAGTNAIAYMHNQREKYRPLAMSSSRMTVEQFVEAYTFTKGRYLIVINGHAMSLIDGIVYDFQEPKWRAKVIVAYQLI